VTQGALIPSAAAPLYPRAALYLTGALLAIITGFYPSYFSQLREVPGLHHFHALTATAWVLLLISQATLARRGGFAIHRAAGRLSYLIAPLVVVSGILVTELMLDRTDPFHDRYAVPLAVEGAIALTWFAAAYALALYHRRNVQLHARYMISTVILVMPAAVARVIGEVLPEAWPFRINFYGAYALCMMGVGVLIAHDARRGLWLAPFRLLLAAQVAAVLAFAVLVET
jgi:hypothetical protein